MKTAFVFLTKKAHEATIRFAKELHKKFDTFIVSDCNTNDDILCIEKGYKGCNITGQETHIKKEVIAYDKFLYLFCESLLNDYDFVWVAEEDVFIPSVDTIINLTNKYSNYDLVTPNNFLKADNANDWHWRHIYDKIKPPYYYSMVSFAGYSKKMLTCVRNYVNENKQLFYQEVMFNTLAMQNNLKVIDAFELKSVVWIGEWGIDEFLLLPNNVFHPIKDISSHQRLREQIIEFKQDKEYKPINKLPDFLRY